MSSHRQCSKGRGWQCRTIKGEINRVKLLVYFILHPCNAPLLSSIFQKLRELQHIKGVENETNFSDIQFPVMVSLMRKRHISIFQYRIISCITRFWKSCFGKLIQNRKSCLFHHFDSQPVFAYVFNQNLSSSKAHCHMFYLPRLPLKPYWYRHFKNIRT